MGALSLILLIIIATVLYNIFSGGGGAKSVVRFVFNEFVKFNSQLKSADDNTFMLLSKTNNIVNTAVFNTERQARAFILNTIFFKRFSNSERESDRYKLEIEVHGKIERFEFVRNGEKNYSNKLYKFQNLGDLICTIWYIESGLRGNYYYGSFGGAFDLQPYLDKYSSMAITDEYEKLCELYAIDDFEL